MASTAGCQCKSPDQSRGPGACPRCGGGSTPPAPFDLAGRLAGNRQGSKPPRRPWLLRFGAGTVAGLFMMAAAVVWFVAGLALGSLFFYPPVLFVLGLGAIAKDVFTPDKS